MGREKCTFCTESSRAAEGESKGTEIQIRSQRTRTQDLKFAGRLNLEVFEAGFKGVVECCCP